MYTWLVCQVAMNIANMYFEQIRCCLKIQMNDFNMFLNVLQTGKAIQLQRIFLGNIKSISIHDSHVFMTKEIDKHFEDRVHKRIESYAMHIF